MLNYISPEQLTSCVFAQEESGSRKKLGVLMVERGYITQEQLDEILRIQYENLNTPTKHPGERLEDTIMGRLAVKYGYVTEEQVNDALRTQALRESEGNFYRLGEILVEKGYISVQNILTLLSMQQKRILSCPNCGAKFNASAFEPGKKYVCKRCKGFLSVPAAIENVDVETTVFVSEEDSGTALPTEIDADEESSEDSRPE